MIPSHRYRWLVMFLEVDDNLFRLNLSQTSLLSLFNRIHDLLPHWMKKSLPIIWVLLSRPLIIGKCILTKRQFWILSHLHFNTMWLASWASSMIHYLCYIMICKVMISISIPWNYSFNSIFMTITPVLVACFHLQMISLDPLFSFFISLYHHFI